MLTDDIHALEFMRGFIEIPCGSCFVPENKAQKCVQGRLQPVVFVIPGNERVLLKGLCTLKHGVVLDMESDLCQQRAW